MLGSHLNMRFQLISFCTCALKIKHLTVALHLTEAEKDGPKSSYSESVSSHKLIAQLFEIETYSTGGLRDQRTGPPKSTKPKPTDVEAKSIPGT
jgi:hypothetical protein